LTNHPLLRIFRLANKQVALRLDFTQRVKSFFFVVVPLEDGSPYSFYYRISVMAIITEMAPQGALSNTKGKRQVELTNKFGEKSNDRLNRGEGGDDQFDRGFDDIIVVWKGLEKKLNFLKHYINVIE
jgi:hypothetical protein